MPNQVPETEKKRRAEQLRRIGAEKRQTFAERFIGMPLAVLVEGRKEKSTGFSIGFSDNYIPVACGRICDANRIVRVMPESFQNGHLIGAVIHE